MYMLIRLVIVMILIISCNERSKFKTQRIDTTYYSTGELKSIKKYNHGKLINLVEYYKNGNLSGEANYYNGNMVGKVIGFYSNGQKNSEECFDSMGRSEGTFSIWYRNGNLKQRGTYEEDKTVDRWEDFFEDGKLADIENYKDNKKDGKWFYFNHMGDTVKIEIYKNDSLVFRQVIDSISK